MSTGNHEVLVGIFKGETQAEDAVELLKNVGFGDDQIGYVLQKESSGRDRLRDMLMGLDIPEEEARYYESEFDAGRSIVLVKHDGRRAEALNILFLNRARMHAYLNIGYTGSDTKVPLQEGTSDQLEASQSFAPGNSSTNPSTPGTYTLVQDEMASLHRLLKDVGLEHLL